MVSMAGAVIDGGRWWWMMVAVSEASQVRCSEGRGKNLLRATNVMESSVALAFFYRA
jgi:hypothetical protein